MRLEDELARVVLRPTIIVPAQIVPFNLLIMRLATIFLLLFLSLVPVQTGSLDRVVHVIVEALSASLICHLLAVLDFAIVQAKLILIHIDQATVFLFAAYLDQFRCGWLCLVIARAEVELARYATQAIFALPFFLHKHLIFALQVLVHHDLLLRAWVNTVLTRPIAERLLIRCKADFIVDLADSLAVSDGSMVVVVVVLECGATDDRIILLETFRAVAAETVPRV